MAWSNNQIVRTYGTYRNKCPSWSPDCPTGIAVRKSGAIKSVMPNGIFYVNNENEFEYDFHLIVICTKIKTLWKILDRLVGTVRVWILKGEILKWVDSWQLTVDKIFFWDLAECGSSWQSLGFDLWFLNDEWWFSNWNKFIHKKLSAQRPPACPACPDWSASGIVLHRGGSF